MKEADDDILNSWVCQAHGPIDRYNAGIHIGNQPVRVIHYMVIHMFAHAHPGFLAELQQQVDEGKLNLELDLLLGDDGLHQRDFYFTPRVDPNTRKIQVHESFLSYLWCITYSIFVLYIETIDYPEINRRVCYIKHPVSEEEIKKARRLFDYARSLIAFYSPWDKVEMPNPEQYLAEKRTYVEQTSSYYTEAMKFILAHEFNHLKMHIDQIEADTPDSHYLAFEQEADSEALVICLKGINEENALVVNCGIVIGLLSMFFFSAVTMGLRHPNTEDRLTAVLDCLDIGNTDPAWGMACVGLQLWDEQFDLHFNWLKAPESPRQQYYHLIEQIKRR